MTLPCPQPGGLPPGRALQPGEAVGKGPAAPPGSMCGSHAIAAPAGFLLPLLGAAVHPGAASSASSAFRKHTSREKTSGLVLGWPASSTLKAKAITRLMRAMQSLSSECGLVDQAKERSQRE